MSKYFYSKKERYKTSKYIFTRCKNYQKLLQQITQEPLQTIMPVKKFGEDEFCIATRRRWA